VILHYLFGSVYGAAGIFGVSKVLTPPPFLLVKVLFKQVELVLLPLATCNVLPLFPPSLVCVLSFPFDVPSF